MNPKPTPRHVMVLDDNGMPMAVMNVDEIQSQSIKLAYEMGAVCGDPAALDALSAKWVAHLGPDAFGYVAAGALRALAQHVLDPTIKVVERIAPDMDLRAQLAASAADPSVGL